MALILSLSAIAGDKTEKGQTGEEGRGNWNVEKEIDPETGKEEITMTLYCNETIEALEAGDNIIGNARSLFLSLSEGNTELMIFWDDIVNEGEILISFDGGQVMQSQWDTGANAVFFPARRENLENFIERLIDVERLEVIIPPDEKAGEKAVFELEGFATALSPYLEEFGWQSLKDKLRN